MCRVEGLDSYQEAAVARDLLLLWRRSAAPASGLQLCGGGVTQSNCDLDRCAIVFVIFLSSLQSSSVHVSTAHAAADTAAAACYLHASKASSFAGTPHVPPPYAVKPLPAPRATPAADGALPRVCAVPPHWCRLEQAEGLMSRLRDCDTSDELLELVECMASSGELTTLADATLPPVEVPPDAAAQPPAATAATPPALLLVRAQPVASARTLSTAAARPALLGSELAPAELSPEDLAPPAPAAAAPTPSKFAGVLKRVGHKWAVMLRVAQDDSGRAKRGVLAALCCGGLGSTWCQVVPMRC